MSLRQLFPVAADQPDLAALYAYPDGRWLRANMVSSVDGAAYLNGVTAGISSETDRQVFALLRTLSDVILVGAATVREERCSRHRELRNTEKRSVIPCAKPGWRCDTPTHSNFLAVRQLPQLSPAVHRRLFGKILGCKPIKATMDLI